MLTRGERIERAAVLTAMIVLVIVGVLFAVGTSSTIAGTYVRSFAALPFLSAGLIDEQEYRRFALRFAPNPASEWWDEQRRLHGR